MKLSWMDGTQKSCGHRIPDLSIKGLYSQADTKRLFSDSLGCEFQAPQSACAIGELKKGLTKR